MTAFYGEASTDLGALDLSEVWHEFMDVLYLPVRIPNRDAGYIASERGGVLFPPHLAFLEDAVYDCWNNAQATGNGTTTFDEPYIYITARRGYASPGNPLNRPGMHCDDFGGSDLNYIWTDAYPTKFLLADKPLNIPDDDSESMAAMERHAAMAERNVDPAYASLRGYETDARHNQRIIDGPVGHLLRLTPHVIHSAPEIPAPGGMRSFFKISVSNHRYDLLGNTHNHELDYSWPMRERTATRNATSAVIPAGTEALR